MDKRTEAEKKSLHHSGESRGPEQQRDRVSSTSMIPPNRTASGVALSHLSQGSSPKVDESTREATVSLIVSDNEQAALDAEHELSGVRKPGRALRDDGFRVVRARGDGVVCATLAPYMNKGTLSNCATFSIMLVGMALKAAAGDGQSLAQGAAKWTLAAGLFGFAGGITNWLAIKMLFDRVLGLPGSGVIPRRFKEIREVVKNTIMKTFFDGPYLEHYMNTKMTSLASNLDLGAKIADALELPEVNDMISRGVDELFKKPEGMMLMMIGLSPDQMKPLVKPFLLAMAPEVGPLVGKTFNMRNILPVEKLRSEIDLLMTEKLQELTPEKVKALMEEVIRTHLGWLIVWGNVFGSLIGIVSVALGYP